MQREPVIALKTPCYGWPKPIKGFRYKLKQPIGSECPFPFSTLLAVNTFRFHFMLTVIIVNKGGFFIRDSFPSVTLKK